MAKNNGTWIDTESGEVVTSPPVTGIQLISPSVEEPTPAEFAAVEAAKAAAVVGDAVVEAVAVEVPAPTVEVEAETEPEVEAEPVDDKPAGNASTEEWRAYAVANGVAEDEAAEMGRDQIRELFA